MAWQTGRFVWLKLKPLFQMILKKRNAPRGWRLQVREVKVSNGAGFHCSSDGKDDANAGNA